MIYIIEPDNKRILKEFEIKSGEFNLRFNFINNLISNYQSRKFYISEISKSKQEIRIKPVIGSCTAEDWQKLYDLDVSDYKKNINVGKNNLFLIINKIFDPGGTNLSDEEILSKLKGSFVLKLYRPLPDEITEKDFIWISEKIANSFEGKEEVHFEKTEPDYDKKLIPNFNVDADGNTDYSEATDYENWDEIVSEDTSLSNDLVNKVLKKRDLNSANLCVDYSNYSNFIHFGDASRQLNNFKTKLEQIEEYTVNSASYASYARKSTISASYIANVDDKIDDIKNNFTKYENYLYYNSESAAWPKTNSDKPYELAHTTSSLSTTWYTSQSNVADSYDMWNENNLIGTIPEFIRIDESNDEYINFIKMVGEYFDNHWLYIKHIEKIYSRKDKLNEGLSKDLIENVGKSFGIDVYTNDGLKKLWNYSYGYYDTGSNYLQTGSIHSMPYENIDIEIWNRLLNNYIYILRSKGTKKSVRSVINCYGIPETALVIKEFGGSVSTASEMNKYEFRTFDYSLDFEGSQYITSSWNPNSNYVKSLEFRFKPSSNIITQSLMSTKNPYTSSLDLFYSGSTYGYLKYHDGDNYILTSSKLPFYNDTFWNVMLQESGSNTFVMSIKNVDEDIDIMKHEEIITGSINSASWNNTETIYFGSSSYGNSNNYSGSLQEIRMWDILLTDNDLTNHTQFAKAHNTTIGTPYNNLITRYSLNKPKNHFDTSSILDIKPNQAWRNNALTIGFSNESIFPYNYNSNIRTETAYVPTIGATIPSSNKIRIEDRSLKSNILNVEEDTEIIPEKYNNTIDLNKLLIAFSPINIIDKHIISYYGNMDYNDFIGDPRDYNKSYYSELEDARKEYFKQYSESNNFWDYLCFIKNYNTTVYEQIKKTVPAKTDLHYGVLVENHILHRPKMKNPELYKENLTYNPDVLFPGEKIDFITNTKKLRTDIDHDVGNLDITNKKLRTDIDHDVGNLDITNKKLRTDIDHDIGNLDVINKKLKSKYQIEIDPNVVNKKLKSKYQIEIDPNVINRKLRSKYQIEIDPNVVNRKLKSKYQIEIDPSIINRKLRTNIENDLADLDIINRTLRTNIENDLADLDIINKKLKSKYQIEIDPNVANRKLRTDIDHDIGDLDVINRKLRTDIDHDIGDLDVINRKLRSKYQIEIDPNVVNRKLRSKYQIEIDPNVINRKLRTNIENDLADLDIINRTLKTTFNYNNNTPIVKQAVLKTEHQITVKPKSDINKIKGCVNNQNTEIYNYIEDFNGNIDNQNTEIYNYIEDFNGQINNQNTEIYNYIDGLEVKIDKLEKTNIESNIQTDYNYIITIIRDNAYNSIKTNLGYTILPIFDWHYMEEVSATTWDNYHKLYYKKSCRYKGALQTKNTTLDEKNPVIDIGASGKKLVVDDKIPPNLDVKN